MTGRLRLLGQRVLARHARSPHVGGLRLAQHVVAARTPERIVESSTRLARGRSIATPTVARAEDKAAIPKPAGMSDFAARWIFGDGPAEGIPIAGEAALADMAPAERPSFLVERDERTAKETLAAKAESERRSQPVPRGRVDEVTPGFRLARRPAPAPAVEAVPSEASEPPLSVAEEPAEALQTASEQAPVSPVVPEPPAAGPEVPPRRNVLSTRPPVARTPEPAAPPRLEAAAALDDAAVPEPPLRTAPAPVAPQSQIDPVLPPPRAKLTLAPAAAPERSARPAIAMRRREPEPAEAVGEPPVEAATPPAPERSLLRRAVDAVFGREPSPPAPRAALPPGAETGPTEPAAAAPRVLTRASEGPWEEGGQPSASAATAAPPAGAAPGSVGPTEGPPPPAGPVPIAYPNEAAAPSEPRGGAEAPADAAGPPEPSAAAPEPVSTPVPLELVESTPTEASTPAPDGSAPAAGPEAAGGASEVTDTTSPESTPASGGSAPAPGGSPPAPDGTPASGAGPVTTPPAGTQPGTPPAPEEEPGARRQQGCPRRAAALPGAQPFGRVQAGTCLGSAVVPRTGCSRHHGLARSARRRNVRSAGSAGSAADRGAADARGRCFEPGLSGWENLPARPAAGRRIGGRGDRDDCCDA